jgi:hypothetical protein
MSGQSVIDRLNAAKHSLSGQGLAKAVCKASTEEVIGPKRKHLDCMCNFFIFNLICFNPNVTKIKQIFIKIIQVSRSVSLRI